MSPVSGKIENLLKLTLESMGFNYKYSVKKPIMNTTLYSVYLISEKEKPKIKDKVLLIEHLPAKEPSVHLLQVTFRESASKKEQLQNIMDAVQEYYADHKYGSV